MRSPEQSNSWRQKEECWCPGELVRGWGHWGGKTGRDEELFFNGYRVSDWEDESALKHGGDACTTICMYLLPLSWTLKND